MKFINVEQGSKEWNELRREKIGASNAAAILGKHPFKNAYDVWQEMVVGTVPFVNKAMEHGSRVEPLARKAFEKKYGVKCDPVVLEHPEIDYMMASLDGLGPDFVLEIKCPQKPTLEAIRKGKVPCYYQIQVQHQLIVSGLNKGVIWVFDEENPDNPEEFEVFLDEEMAQEILESQKDFYENHVITMIPPKSSKVEFVERLDKEWSEIEQEAAKAYDAKKEADEILKACKEKLVELANGSPCKGDCFKLYQKSRDGSYDWSNVPEELLKQLQPFKKPSTMFWELKRI